MKLVPLGALALGLASAGTALVAAGAPGLAVPVLAVAWLATIGIAVQVAGTWASLTLIFVAFHGIYGLSGPVAVLNGGALPWGFSTPYRVEAYLVEFGLATLGLAGALLLAVRFGLVRLGGDTARPQWDASPLVGITLVAVGSLFEVINCLRAGGWPIILRGKAAYQSEVDALVLTLPSSQMVSLGLVLATLAVALSSESGGPRLRRRELLLGVLAISPSAAITLALGFRAPLLDWLLVVIVGVYYLTPIRRISWRMVVLVLTLYLGSGLVFANRALIGFGLVTGDWGAVWEAAGSPERLALGLNPAATEFGAAFGNFSEYVTRSSEAPRLGVTYVRALTSPIPGFLYPGTKPQQVGYEFRDRFFPELARAGAIAGTAYSSLLEAYVNFGVAGGALVYFVVGFLLVSAERIRQRSAGLGWHLMYVLLLSNAVAFHRSDLSLLTSTLALNVVVIAVFFVVRTGSAWLLSATSAPGVSSPDLTA